MHDHLWAKAMVVDDGREQIAMVTVDLLNVLDGFVEEARRKIERQLAIRADHVMISATHSHTNPELTANYTAELIPRIVDSVKTAVGTKLPVNLYATAEQEASLPHNRRYLMKDGKVVTNPGFLNPDVVCPVGPIDPRVFVLYTESCGREPLLTWVNYTLHPDTVGDTWISADYPLDEAPAIGSHDRPGRVWLAHREPLVCVLADSATAPRPSSAHMSLLARVEGRPVERRDQTWRLRSFAKDAGLTRCDLFFMDFQPDGAAWIATLDGLYRHGGFRWRRFSVEDGFPSPAIGTVLVTREGA